MGNDNPQVTIVYSADAGLFCGGTVEGDRTVPYIYKVASLYEQPQTPDTNYARNQH